MIGVSQLITGFDKYDMQKISAVISEWCLSLLFFTNIQFKYYQFNKMQTDELSVYSTQFYLKLNASQDKK